MAISTRKQWISVRQATGLLKCSPKELRRLARELKWKKKREDLNNNRKRLLLSHKDIRDYLKRNLPSFSPEPNIEVSNNPSIQIYREYFRNTIIKYEEENNSLKKSNLIFKSSIIFIIVSSIVAGIFLFTDLNDRNKEIVRLNISHENKDILINNLTNSIENLHTELQNSAEELSQAKDQIILKEIDHSRTIKEIYEHFNEPKTKRISR